MVRTAAFDAGLDRERIGDGSCHGEWQRHRVAIKPLAAAVEIKRITGLVICHPLRSIDSSVAEIGGRIMSNGSGPFLERQIQYWNKVRHHRRR